MSEVSEFETWAESELRRAGLFDSDSDYDGMLGPAAMGLVHAFAGQGHSGFSAAYVAHLFSQLAARRPLTALTDGPDEWMHIDENAAGDATTWQSRRQPSAFSNDAGKTYYDLDERRKRWRRWAVWVARRAHVYRPWQFAKRHTTLRGNA